MTDREAMQKSLAVHEFYAGQHGWPDDIGEAITALRDRLEQPEPPVLTGIDCSCGKKWRILNNTLTASEQGGMDETKVHSAA